MNSSLPRKVQSTFITYKYGIMRTWKKQVLLQRKPSVDACTDLFVRILYLALFSAKNSKWRRFWKFPQNDLLNPLNELSLMETDRLTVSQIDK